MQLTHGSLFSGIGGFDYAAMKNNIKNVFHCEIEEDKRAILKKHFPYSNSYCDIQKFNALKYENKITILSGGFPCQDISISQQSKKTNGAQGIKGKRSGLWNEYARIVGEIKPKYIIFENSPMLLIRGFEYVLCSLHELGYDVEWRCFYASDFGLPHFRKRIYGIAHARSQRCKNIIEEGGILQKIFPKKAPRQSPVPIPIKRFDSYSSYENVRMVDGFSEKLDKRLIHGYGNAIIPEIASLIFNEIKQHENKSLPGANLVTIT